MLNSAQQYAVVRTELDNVFYQNFNEDSAFPSRATATTAALFKPMTIDRQAWIEEIFKGSNLFGQTAETGTVNQFNAAVSNKLVTQVVDYTNSIKLSKNLFDDNMHGYYSKIVADMALKARRTQDYNAFGVFRGAFTTTLTADGAAWISASHTLLNGETLSNLVTGSLTPTSLNNAIIALTQQKDQAGVILGMSPAYLVVPTPLYKHAVEITQSALIADSANNNVNVYRSAYGITIYTSPYLDAVSGGSDTAWFLLGRNHCVTRIVRQGIQTFLRDWGYSDDRTYTYQANFREVVYVADYAGAVGSTGV